MKSRYGTAAGRRPTATEVQKLVEAWGRVLGAAKMGAGVKTEEKLRARFRSMRDRLAVKYPEVDMESESFHRNLNNRALAWWDAREFKGPAVDW